MSYSSDFDFSTSGGPTYTGGGGGGFWDDLFNFGGNPGSGISVSLPGSSGPSVNQTLTALVNAAEAALQANLAAWRAQQTGTDAALSNGWRILNDVVARLTGMGAQGVKSAAERDRRIDPSQLRWDWIAYYLDPITGGPTNPQPLPAPVAGGGLGAGGSGVYTGGVGGVGGGVGAGGIPTSYLLIAGAVILLIWMDRK